MRKEFQELREKGICPFSKNPCNRAMDCKARKFAVCKILQNHEVHSCVECKQKKGACFWSCVHIL